MASSDEVQAMMESITKIRNDVESRLNKAMDMMERNLELDQKQKQLLNEQKTKLAITEKELGEKVEFKFEKAESRLNKMMTDMMEKNIDLDKKQKQSLKELEAKLAIKEKLLREEIKQHFQKEFDEYKRNSEENYQQQLRKQGEELNDKIRKKSSKLLSESTDSHKQLLNRVDCPTRSITTSVRPPATTATNDIVRSGRETKGTYPNWGFGGEEERFIPLSELKITLTKLQNLDITVKAQKALAMALIGQLFSSKITVRRNRRFPLKGVYVYYNRINELYTYIKDIDYDCVNIDYNNSKTVIFNKFVQIGNDKGWEEAHLYAWESYWSVEKTTPQSLLDKYLWLLCILMNIEKVNSLQCFFNVCDVTTFEKHYNLTWKEVEY